MKLAGSCYFTGMAVIAIGIWGTNPTLAIGVILFLNGSGAISGDHLERVSQHSDRQFKEIRDELDKIKADVSDIRYK
jgi:hypothetical protein